MPSLLHHCLKGLMMLKNLNYYLLLLELVVNFEQQVENFDFALLDYLKLQIVVLLEVDCLLDYFELH